MKISKANIAIFLVIVAILGAVFILYKTSYPNNNHITLTKVEPTDTPGLYLVTLEMQLDSLSCEIGYDHNPRVPSGSILGISGPKHERGTIVEISMPFGNLNDPSSESINDLICVPLNSAISIKDGDNFCLFKTISEEGEVCSVFLRAEKVRLIPKFQIDRLPYKKRL